MNHPVAQRQAATKQQAQYMGTSSQIKLLFETFETRLPKEFWPLLEEDDVVIVAEFDEAHALNRLSAYRAFPRGEGLTFIDVSAAWAASKLWFRKRPAHLPCHGSLNKYETFFSYLEEYRPEFEVDQKSPLFSLAITR